MELKTFIMFVLLFIVVFFLGIALMQHVASIMASTWDPSTGDVFIPPSPIDG